MIPPEGSRCVPPQGPLETQGEEFRLLLDGELIQVLPDEIRVVFRESADWYLVS